MKRGPKSAADLSVVAATGARLAPLDELTEAQAAVWSAIVDSLPADWFRPADAHLLGAYCVAAAFYTEAKLDLEKNGLTLKDDKGRRYVNPAHQILTSQASSMAQMAVKLRLCPSARYTEKTAATKTNRAAPGRKPWEDAGTK